MARSPLLALPLFLLSAIAAARPGVHFVGPSETLVISYTISTPKPSIHLSFSSSSDLDPTVALFLPNSLPFSDLAGRPLRPGRRRLPRARAVDVLAVAGALALGVFIGISMSVALCLVWHAVDRRSVVRGSDWSGDEDGMGSSMDAGYYVEMDSCRPPAKEGYEGN